MQEWEAKMRSSVLKPFSFNCSTPFRFDLSNSGKKQIFSEQNTEEAHLHLKNLNAMRCQRGNFTS